MATTFAQLNSELWLALNKVERHLCDRDEMHYALRRSVTVRTGQARASDNNQPVSVSAEFTPVASPHEITALVAKGTVAWVEMQANSRWQPLRSVNRVFLEEMFRQSINAVAVYGDETNKTYLDFSFPVNSNSTQVYRIWFDVDIVPTVNTSEILIPDHLVPLLIIDAEQELIPKITLRLAESVENQDEQKRKAVMLQIAAWDGIKAQNAVNLKTKWEPLFRRWKNRSRTAQNMSRLPAKSGKGMYPR